MVCFSECESEITHFKSPRIVGGEEAVPGAYPWMASIGKAYINDIYNAHYCAGSLIHPQWIVTAAHCLTNDWSTLPIQTDLIKVVLGVHDLAKPPSDPNSWVRMSVKKIIIHPNYHPITNDYDIGLAELSESVSFDIIQPVSAHFPIEGLTGTVIGWGQISNDGPTSSVLLQVTVPIISNDTCNDAYNNLGTSGLNPITPNMVCAGDPSGKKDSCYGDSGGPLMIREGDIWKLAGIVSWGEKCATPGLYGIYTRVALFTDFIQQSIIQSSEPIAGDFTKNGRLELDDVIGILQVISGIRK